MQFQLLAQEALNQDISYQQLLKKLDLKQQKCLKAATNSEQITKCFDKRQQFETYLSEYSYQYRQKGRKICNESMKRVGIDEKNKVKNDCVNFYHKGVSIYQQNVRDKLRSIVDNIDFSQL